MDFGRPLVEKPSVASKSNIRFIELLTVDQAVGETVEERQHNLQLDNAVVQASNEVAAQSFLNDETTVITREIAYLIDATQFTDRLTPEKYTIQTGDLVVIQESFDKLDFVYCQPGQIYSNRNGQFHHDDFLNKPFGTKLRSRNYKGFGFCYLLKPTPELWTRSLKQRTQVVQELDQSQIFFQLYIKPNDIVVESGTGSGALSHGILRTIAPNGHLHTYEFNRHRSESARLEFQQHGLGHLVTVYHKDVCRADGTAAAGFDLPAQSVDAVVLDLPEPWLAVPHAAYILKPNSRIASYSPCVEQTQRTVQKLETCGFHSIQTFEYRLQEHYVDQVEYEPPPSAKRIKPTVHAVLNYQQQQEPTEEVTVPDRAENGTANETDATNGTRKTPVGTKRRLVARPFVTMRGHTAFLTFATAGNLPQPNPNE